MPLFGVLKTSFFISCIAFSSHVFADQYLDGQSNLPTIDLKKSTNDFSYLPDSAPEIMKEGSTQTTALPGKSENLKLKKKEKKSILSSGYTMPGEFSSEKGYVEYSKKDFFYQLENKGKSAFSFYYIRDNYSIADNKNIYSKTYKTSTGSQEGGSLLFNWDRYFYRNWVNLAWGLNLGFGYSEGRGIFIDGSQSDAIFKLWSLPVDLSLTMEVPLGSWMKVAVTGGPSAMGLWQNRSDYAENENGKDIRQVSYGYFAGAKFKVSLSRMMLKEAVNMFDSSGISNMFLSLEARMQNYENFQDNISISGTSFGVGFTFEYF